MNRENYGPAAAMPSAKIEKTNDNTWTLVLVRELKHPPRLVWKALTDPAQLAQWAPFDADTNLGVAGATAKLTTVGAPPQYATTETKVKRADAEKALEYSWGGGDMRWELEPLGDNGTRLRLWAMINKGFIAMGAAGWHVCFDVLDQLLAGSPLGRIAGPTAMQVNGFHRLHEEYAKQFGVEMPKWNQGSSAS